MPNGICIFTTSSSPVKRGKTAKEESMKLKILMGFCKTGLIEITPEQYYKLRSYFQNKRFRMKPFVRPDWEEASLSDEVIKHEVYYFIGERGKSMPLPINTKDMVHYEVYQLLTS